MMQVNQSADCVAGDFGGDFGVLATIRVVVTGDSAACFADAGMKKPVAGALDDCGWGRDLGLQSKHFNIHKLC
jgi:hypothetical protein